MVEPLSGRGGDAEKITINLGLVDPGQIDLLVRESFYAHRTDFIRTAIRNQLERHGEPVRHAVVRQRLPTACADRRAAFTRGTACP